MAVLKVDHELMDLGDDLVVQVLDEVLEVELCTFFFVVLLNNKAETVLED